MKQRIEYLDIAKGIAFLLVIFCHSVAFTDIQDGSCRLLHYIRYHSVWYAYFFMAVFFIVSGFFINTDKPLKTYLWTNVKMLVLGIIGIRFLDTLIRCTLTLNPTGMLDFIKNVFSESILMFWGTWFIGALFVARMLYFALSKVTNKDWLLGILLIICAIGGGYLEKLQVPDILWHQQGMSLCIFIWVGTLLKRFALSTRQLLTLGGIYIVLFVILELFGMNTIDSYCSMRHAPDMCQLPASIIMGVLGSCLVLGVSKAIGKCQALSFIGKNSTVWYIVNGCTYIGMKIGRMIVPLDSTMHVIIYLLIVMATVIAYSTVFTFIINLKYVRILKGDTQDIKTITRKRVGQSNNYDQ